MNVPTAPYTPRRPSAFEAQPYVGWLVDKAVRVGRQNGYGTIVDDALVLILGDLGVTKPVGGFVDSDGVNAAGKRTVKQPEPVVEDDEIDVEAMVDGWDTDTAAAVLRELAGRVE